MGFGRIVVSTLLCGTLAFVAGCSRAEPVSDEQMRSQVRGDIARVMSDIDRAMESSPAIAVRSDALGYAAISPALDDLVARGEPALESIAAEIETSPNDGLREYLLALAGQRIMDTDIADPSWGSGKEWARAYRTDR